MTKSFALYGLALAATLVLAGCSGSDREISPDGAVNMTLACQTTECECVEVTDSIFATPKKADLIWPERGGPTCPAGYKLRRVETDFLGRKK